MNSTDTVRPRLSKAAAGKRTGDAQQQQVGEKSFDTTMRLSALTPSGLELHSLPTDLYTYLYRRSLGRRLAAKEFVLELCSGQEAGSGIEHKPKGVVVQCI